MLSVRMHMVWVEQVTTPERCGLVRFGDSSRLVCGDLEYEDSHLRYRWPS